MFTANEGSDGCHSPVITNKQERHEKVTFLFTVYSQSHSWSFRVWWFLTSNTVQDSQSVSPIDEWTNNHVSVKRQVKARVSPLLVFPILSCIRIHQREMTERVLLFQTICRSFCDFLSLKEQNKCSERPILTCPKQRSDEGCPDVKVDYVCRADSVKQTRESCKK